MNHFDEIEALRRRLAQADRSNSRQRALDVAERKRIIRRVAKLDPVRLQVNDTVSDILHEFAVLLDSIGVPPLPCVFWRHKPFVFKKSDFGHEQWWGKYTGQFAGFHAWPLMSPRARIGSLFAVTENSELVQVKCMPKAVQITHDPIKGNVAYYRFSGVKKKERVLMVYRRQNAKRADARSCLTQHSTIYSWTDHVGEAELPSHGSLSVRQLMVGALKFYVQARHDGRPYYPN